MQTRRRGSFTTGGGGGIDSQLRDIRLPLGEKLSITKGDVAAARHVAELTPIPEAMWAKQDLGDGRFAVSRYHTDGTRHWSVEGGVVKGG